MPESRDPKAEALRAQRCLNPRPEAVSDEAFAGSEFFDARDLVQVKYEVVRRVQVDGQTVSAAAAAFGFSRPSFYQAAAAVQAGDAPKGDVLGVARIAGIQAAKRTSELIPLCHPLPMTFVGVEAEIDADAGEVTLTAEARATARTGVEMEALTAVSVAALTLYDMLKAADKAMVIGRVRVRLKEGGKSGRYEAP